MQLRVVLADQHGKDYLVAAGTGSPPNGCERPPRRSGEMLDNHHYLAPEAPADDTGQ